MVAAARYIKNRPDLPGPPFTPSGADHPVADVHPVIEAEVEVVEDDVEPVVEEPTPEPVVEEPVKPKRRARAKPVTTQADEEPVA